MASTAPSAPGLPTAHAVHLDDLEKNGSHVPGKAGAETAVATAHPVGTKTTGTGSAEPSGKSSTSLAKGAAAGAAVVAAGAAGVAALANHNKNRKPEDHSLPKVGRRRAVQRTARRKKHSGCLLFRWHHETARSASTAFL